MTDNEIIKALECCKSMVSSCEECPMHIEGAICHEYELNKKALTLINRQKAEIERLKEENEMLNTTVINQCAFNKQDIYFARAEAIKEFATRLEEYSYESMGNYGISRMVVSVKDIDNLVKEMVGEKE